MMKNICVCCGAPIPKGRIVCIGYKKEVKK